MKPLGLRLGGHHNVCRSPNQSPVAPEASSERQRPGQGLDADARDGLDHLHHHRHHGGGEGDVVDKGREDGRGPADEEEREVLSSFHWHRRHHATQGVGNEAQQAKLSHTLHHHKQRGEEEQRIPFDSMQGLVTVMHVEGDQQPYGSHDRDPGRVEVSHRMKEERADHTTQHNSALDEEGSVGDRVHLLQLRDVDGEVPLDSVLEVPDKVVEREGAGQDDSRAKVEEERIEVKILGQQVPDDDVWRITNHG
mmetsp:Transcript_19559/g.44742  ORF Transcript_19559/g.44742 Transcript_19559/m.44742 type:complete len:251 (-) Transcript_19559:1533-2285(-)